jgi:hypothetical protein
MEIISTNLKVIQYDIRNKGPHAAAGRDATAELADE